MPTRLERLVAIKKEIDRGRYPTVQRLCEMFEIQPRTLHEDLRMMRDMMGLEIKHDRIRNGYYNADPSQQLPTFDLTVGEVFALTLAKEMLSEYTGTPFQAILQDALEKIQQRLPEKVLIEVGDVEGAVFSGRVPASPFSKKMFLDLYHACANNQKVKIDYFSAYKGELTTRVVDPYRVLAHQNTWYVVAYCNLRQDLRLFALHRIQHHELLEETFQPMDSTKLEDWLKSPLFIEHQEHAVDISIKFEPRAARYVKEKIWHPSQEIVCHDDGSCTLTFTTAGTDEVKRWLLAYGPEAEVLGPPSLRSAIAADLKRAAGKYRDLDSVVPLANAAEPLSIGFSSDQFTQVCQRLWYHSICSFSANGCFAIPGQSRKCC